MLLPILLAVPFLVMARAFNSISGIIYGSFFVFSGPLTWLAATLCVTIGYKTGEHSAALNALGRTYVFSLITLLVIIPIGFLVNEKLVNTSLLFFGTGLLLLVVAFLLISPKTGTNVTLSLLGCIIIFTLVSSVQDAIYPTQFIKMLFLIAAWIGMFSLLYAVPESK